MSDISVNDDNVLDVALSDTLGDRYLSYALSTIMSRSLPDVRDGLKPVHRRLLFAMRHLKLNPETGFKKCARVVGDVIGKYHPHGDQSVYDAMVRLAQEFAVRYPLVDGQGNFGNIDGDNAAAMRYTEARMTAIATALMEGLDQDAVDFRETYDGEEEEPIVMPANFPNLLANGATGIAVGMATSIPPHNVGEICNALLHLIKFPNATIEKIVTFINGPDFPTGGTIVEPRESIIRSYETGRGSFRLRAKWEVEDTGRGMYQIVITEIPYQVQKSKLIERIADLMYQKKLPLLADILDESSEDIRIVVEPKSRTVEPEVLMESLFRLTDLETRASLNMNVLEGGKLPRVMSLREVLQAFLDHRQDVLVRRSKYRLGKIEHRLEVLGGYLIAYLNLDEVIRIIREEDAVKKCLMDTFSLTEVQAESILNMRLRSLRKLEEMEIKTEYEALEAEKAGLLELLASEDLRWTHISDEIKDIRKKFGAKTELGARRTLFADAPVVDMIPVEAMIEKEPITVICSHKGWVRGMKGHVAIDDKIKYKDGDKPKFGFTAYTTDKMILVASNGRFYTLGCDKLPGGRGHGEPVRLMIDLPNEEEIIGLFVHQPGKKIMVVSERGRGFMLDADNVIASTKNGKQVMNVEDGKNKVAVCRIIEDEDDHVAIIGTSRKMLIFPIDQMPQMNRGRGPILQKYNEAQLGDIISFKAEEGLSWPMKGGKTRTETDLTAWLGRRGSVGRMPPHGFPTTNRFS
ncbi:DNA topoisomerase IV subunit A [Paremcibacter congregatus]|uniref:DNA topoisomerase 4 subunit A n=1 Tax=Paremcibacter congregatus TaxID=2043170 RepID=A0A2G4YN40_9PROT|nr:DNA topoisomerase IV subunit A [Paremcibacter congregatus]PHZ83730.1 DNA topoisomerase IV subunit A [Paremcibacter congregatus]QDE27431.1 DNA topoisomerase IV subunit A [Paremcibacter congregatus]